jgi:hypothetical protein
MANTTITIAMPIRMLRNSGSMSSSQKGKEPQKWDLLRLSLLSGEW